MWEGVENPGGRAQEYDTREEEKGRWKNYRYCVNPCFLLGWPTQLGLRDSFARSLLSHQNFWKVLKPSRYLNTRLTPGAQMLKPFLELSFLAPGNFNPSQIWATLALVCLARAWLSHPISLQRIVNFLGWENFGWQGKGIAKGQEDGI